MFHWLKKLGNWFDARVGFSETVLPMMLHPVPRSIEGPMGWWYVFGSAASVILGLQVVTGILLALVYTPSASNAWNSLQFLDHNVQLGWFLRAR